MGVICTDPPPPQDSPPPPQDSPPPKKWQKKKYYLTCGPLSKRVVTQPHPGVKQLAKSCCLSTPFQLLSYGDVETTVHEDDGRKRVLRAEVPLNHLLPSKSTLISLTTLWVNILLRKVVKIKHLSWAYVLHILNGEAASITSDELFKMSIQSSREDVATQVFSSVLQNESLQHELFNFLKAFAQICIAKGGMLPLQHLELTISSDIMETSGLRIEFESLMKGEYERVLKAHTTPDSSGGPPHLTAYLTVLVDHVQISEKPSGNSNGVNQSLENCKHQHTPHAASREESTTMEELQARKCPTPLTSTTNGTASKGSKDPCIHAVKHANKKPQALKKDPATGDEISSTADDQNHGDVTKFESSTTAQPKPVENKHMHDPGRYKPEEIKNDSNSNFSDIQDDTFNLSTTTAETESATSSNMYSCMAQNPELSDSVRKETNYPCETSTSRHKPPHSSPPLTPPLPHTGEQLVYSMKQETESTTVYGQSSLPPPVLSQEKLLWHVKQQVTQETVPAQNSETRTENGGVPNISNDTMLSSPTSDGQNCGDVPKFGSSTIAQSIPVEKRHLKPELERDSNCKFANIQDVSSNSNTTGAKTESATSSSMYNGVTQNSEQPCSVGKEAYDSYEEPAASQNTPTHSSSSLPPPSPHAGEQLVCPTKKETQSTATCGQFPLPSPTECSEKLLWHIKQPITQVTILTQIPEAKREPVPSNSNDTMLSAPISEPSPPHSWEIEVKRNSSNLASLKSFIQSLPTVVWTLKDAAQGKTLCHTLVGLCDQGFTSSDVIHLLELFEEHFLQQCMACQDSSGNTPLHCSVDVQKANTETVKFLLKFTSREFLLIVNNDNLTASELSFERSHWLITKLLIEHQIETRASCAAELLQQHIHKAVQREGKANLLSHLLDLRGDHCPNLNLNFGSSESSRTPWGYLVDCTSDVGHMNRVLQALKDHSIEFKNLLTRTDGGKILVDEAMEKNKALFIVIQRFSGWVHSEEDQGAPSKERSNSSDLGEESMEITFNMINIAEWPPICEEEHVTHDKERLSVSGSEILPQKTPNYPSPPSKMASYQSSSESQFAQVRLQIWLSQCDGEFLTEDRYCQIPLANGSSDQFEFPRSSSSSGMETGGVRLPNKGNSIFRSRQPKTNAIFREFSTSESEVECTSCHKFSDPAQRFFQAVAEDKEKKLPPDILPSETNTVQYFESTTKLPLAGEPFNLNLQPASVIPVANLVPEDTSQSSSESLSGMSSLEADDSSDGVSGGTIPRTKHSASLLQRKHKKATSAIHSVSHVTNKGKKSLLVRYQRSGYSGDDSDHKNECIKMKSSKCTRAQRAAGIQRKERLHSSSSSEYSEGEIEEYSAEIENTEYHQDASYGATYSIKLSILFTVCKLQLLKSADNLSLMSSSTPNLRRSTKLHHAVRQQCLQSVKRILSCDGGDDQIHARDENGHTPLETASQIRDLEIFEMLLENLVCSQASPSVTLPPCSGHHQVTLMTSIVKVLSRLEIDICPYTLHWTIVGCQHWELPKVLYATPTTVLTTVFLQAELLCYYNQILIEELLGRGIKKRMDNMMSEELETQEQGTPFQSELVSDVRDILVFYRPAGMNSLVTGITQTRSEGFESHQRQRRTSTVIPPHQSNRTLDASAARKVPSSTNSTPSSGATGSTLLHVVADSPSYSQHKSSATKLSTPKQVSQSTDASPRSLGKVCDQDTSPRSLAKVSDEEVTAWQAWVEKAVDCLHAGYYSQMLEVLKFGKVLPSLPPEIAMAVQFGYALAYYKLDKHSEAAKHLESLKTIAASAQSCGNESIASVYLGDIEFTQSRYTEAAKHYSHALELYKGDDNVGKEYRLVVPTPSAISAKLGSSFRNASKIVDAVQAYRQAIAMADSKKDKLSAHTSLGNLFQSVGENASALAEYEHSIRLSEELQDHVSLGWAYGNMGNAYLGLYQRDKGLNYLMKALDLTVEHEPTPQAISRAFNNLGTAYQALNELDKAEENYDLALSQSIYGNDLPGQARVYGNIGNVLMLRKDYERAIPHYTEVLHLSRDRSTVSTAFHNRGCSYYEWAESRKATLFQKDDSSVKKDQFFLSGPDFKDCEVEHQPPVLPNSILKYYQQGRQDLEEVVKYHEETFDNIKGSSKGLTLSVSLFETNSRTFHRLQDCLVNLGEWEKALVVAEQSRTRTLGELLVKRKGWQIDHPLTAPLNIGTISDIVKSQQSIVVYLSYTGARLLGWVLAPKSSKVSMNMFEVPLEDDQFEGKSFDYHLRYSLTELLVERNFEMYRTVDYQSELNEPVRKLYRLVGRPLMKIFKELKDPDSTPGVQDIVIIPDSYTNLIPFPCLLAEEDGVEFLGDSFSFRIMPSLLTMGIVDQLPSVVVQVPADSQNMCVVGNPTVPTFVYNDEKWNLGKLPFATKEAEWVASTLKTTPILHEQATKNAVLMRIMNAKVIHMATHGSASAGFLALAGMSSRNEAAEAKSILLYPEDVERLNISPALVVLSSCDSGRGMVKADGILGMARAFILAGAQAVLTTLWRVPDESASIFMQFFYQYLMDGLKASLALQKATLSLRCFSKYSQYIHWSGYQLTGREIQFDITTPSTAVALEARLGKSSVFPRLEVVKQLESAFLRDPHTPSDVQVLRGSPGVKPSEPLIDFIHSFHHAFKGGIFWINGRRQELIDASAAYIKQVTGTVPTASQTHPILIIFDYVDQMPQFSDPATSLTTLLRNPNTHIVVISKNYAPPDALLKEVDHQLLRGCRIIDVEPLSMIHTSQRIVHSILNAHHLAPTNEDQNFFEKLAEFTSGSPVLTDVITALLLSEIKHDYRDKPQDICDTLMNFKYQLCLDEMGPSTKPVTVVRHEPPKGTALVREISKNVYDHIDSIKETGHDPWCTSSTYDSWQAVAMLVDHCGLIAEEKLLLFAMSLFSCSPIPMSMATEVSLMIAKASQKPHISTSLHFKLFQMHLMKRYPLPVILHPSLNTQKQSTEPEFVYMPQYIARAIWKDMMSTRDKVMALSTSFMALRTLADNTSSSDMGFLGGLSSLLLEAYELNYELMGKKCYQEIYKLYLHFHVGEIQHSGGTHSAPQFKISDPT